jgi:OOP family OmpA-OmpF porin
VKKIVLLAAACLFAGGLLAAPESAPIVVTGTVADEASKAGVLARLRELYGAERVVDQLTIGTVSMPANWNTYVQKLIGPNLKLISRGQLKVDGNVVSLRGEVANEAQRQRIASEIGASLNPTYTVNNGLHVVAPEQAVLDAALARRIVEFRSGKAELTESGRRVLDEMSAALLKMNGKKVAVVGHTDNLGPRAINLALSQARAEAVKAYVTGKGVDPASIAASGEGPDRPVADNGSRDGRMRNRRVEFKVVQ